MGAVEGAGSGANRNYDSSKNRSKYVSSNNTSPTSINRQDNANIAKQYGVSTNGNNSANYNTISKSVGQSMINQGATAPQLAAAKEVVTPQVVTPTVTEDDYSDQLADAIASWYQSMKAKSDDYYTKAQNASDLNFAKLRRAYIAQNARSKRELKNDYAKIGQNPSHSTGWDMDYATSKNLADLDIAKAQNDANIAKGKYDDSNTYISNVLSSGLSNSALYKALKNII